VAPAQNTFQIFIAFLALYSGFICVLIHFAGAERLRPLPYYIMCVGIGAGAYPFLLYLTWGSTSPLTTRGVHDFVGVFVAYIFAGVFALMLARKLGPPSSSGAATGFPIAATSASPSRQAGSGSPSTTSSSRTPSEAWSGR
jgi:ammonia channel protein AmtB